MCPKTRRTLHFPAGRSDLTHQLRADVNSGLVSHVDETQLSHTIFFKKDFRKRF